MAVDLRHFRSFVVVAEEGNIGRAATRLFITQPALSRQLQHLEEELGVALFVRGPRGVEMTDAGRELLVTARTALDAAEQALTIGKAAEPAGRLALGVSIAGHRDHWFELAEAFSAHYPRVDVEIHTALSELLQRQVVAGELDVAIVLEPNRLPRLSYQRVREEPLFGGCIVGIQLQDPRAVCRRGRNAGIRRGTEFVPLNALREPGALSVSIDVGYPDEVARRQLVPPKTMHYDVVHRTDVATAGVRAFAAFAARHPAAA